MGAYYRVSPKFWADARRHRWDDRTKIVALYLLTNGHRSTEGLYELAAEYVHADLGYPLRAVKDAMGRLEDDGFIEYDDDARVVFVCKALKYQAPATDNQITGAIRRLKDLPPTRLSDRIVMAAECHCPKLAEAMRMELGWHSNGTRVP